MNDELATCPRCGDRFPTGGKVRGGCPKCMLEFAFEDVVTRTVRSPGMPIPPTSPDLIPGESFGKYEIGELLGRGGMGVVYSAHDRALDRRIAIKILLPELARDADFAERFKREARALAALSHPNIVSIHDFGCEEGRFYFVMEFVDGTSLREVIAEGGMAPAQALEVVPQLCDALQYSHTEGVVHRDLKPENILVDRSGRVKIADFGLVKMVGGKADESRGITRSNVVMGTAHYMAPEQMESSKDVDHRADIYSLGVVFYEMLTGELPIGKFDPPSRKVEVNVRLDDVVLKALEKSPERRYQNASEVKEDATRYGRLPAGARRRSRALLLLIGAGIVLLVLSIVFGIMVIEPKGPAERAKPDKSEAGKSGPRPVPHVSPGELDDHSKAKVLEARNWASVLRDKESTAQQRETATARLMRLWPHGRGPLVEVAKGEGEPAAIAARLLGEYDLVARLREWTEDSIAFWTVVWDLRHEDESRFRLLFETVYDGDNAAVDRIENIHETLQDVLARYMTEWSERYSSTDTEDKERKDRLAKEVKDTGVTLAPAFIRILEEDMYAAFQRMSREPFQSLWTRKFTARDQVKAIFALAWLGRKETVPALARHLKSPSLTAQSRAAEALQMITGEKFLKEGEFYLSDESRDKALRWWAKKRHHYLRARKGR